MDECEDELSRSHTGSHGPPHVATTGGQARGGFREHNEAVARPRQRAHPCEHRAQFETNACYYRTYVGGHHSCVLRLNRRAATGITPIKRKESVGVRQGGTISFMLHCIAIGVVSRVAFAVPCIMHCVALDWRY